MTHNELSGAIIGAAIEVHRELGPGLLESIYEHCLAKELLALGIPFRRQHLVQLKYKGEALEQGFKLDLWVADKVVVEVKAVEVIHDVHFAQLLSYLKLTNSQLWLLVNFNEPVLRDGIRCVVNGLREPF